MMNYHLIIVQSVLEVAATMILPMSVRPYVQISTGGIGFAVGKALAIESEDGSGNKFNITLVNGTHTRTYFVQF